MVHALEKVHGLLKPGGYVVDVQEMPYWRWLGVMSGDDVQLAGPQESSVDFKDNLQASAAITQVIEDGLFVLEDERMFYGYTHSETLEDMLDYVTIRPSEQTIQRLEDLLAGADEAAQVVIRQPTRMVRLRAL